MDSIDLEVILYSGGRCCGVLEVLGCPETKIGGVVALIEMVCVIATPALCAGLCARTQQS
jgi:hypothetical protein